MEADEIEQALRGHAAWLASQPGGVRAVLRRVCLDGGRLPDVRLDGAVLTHASLRQADLSGADLRTADLRFADLTGANLREAHLSDADLRWSVLAEADLTGASLARARLKGSALAGLTVNWTDRTLVAEILWRAAGTDIFRRMLAAFIEREEDWCWDRFLAVPTIERQWALDELRRWVKETDDVPELLRDSVDYGAADHAFDANRDRLGIAGGQ